MTRLSLLISSGDPLANILPWAKQKMLSANCIITLMLCSITKRVIPKSWLTLMNEPEMLLLDEPTAGINPTLINGIIDRLIKVNQDFGITLLVIEHNMRVIMQLAEDIFCLAHGKMLANGSPDEIKNDKRVIDAYLGAQ